MKRLLVITVILMPFVVALLSLDTSAQRRITPINTAATMTQPINETQNDTARINARRRANSVHYHDENGNVVYVDTVLGVEWVDSAAMTQQIARMKYPLLTSASAGLNIWDPVMRAFGQHYGVADVWGQLNMHNRYLPTFEIGLGCANNSPAGSNFTYRSPLSVYFRIGADYNFLYNSTTDYMFTAGLRYGFSPFSYNISDITLHNNYWDENVHTSIPSTHTTAGWLELRLGLRVKLWGPISAGWQFKYSSLLHEGPAPNGKPWYIPGFGSRSSGIGGSFSVIYTIPLNKSLVTKVNSENNSSQPSDKQEQ